MKLLFLLVVYLLIAPSAFAKERTWRNSQGSSFVGDFISQNDSEVTIRRASDRKEFSVPILQLSQEDQDYLKQLPKNGELASLEPTYWAGKWEDNNSTFIFEIQKVPDEENQYRLRNQWIDEQGEVGEETIIGRYTGEFYHIACYNIRLHGDRGVVAARFGSSPPVRFSMSNLVRLPSDHEPLLELNLAKYGWKREKIDFDQKDYRVPVALTYSNSSDYYRRKKQEVNIFSNGDFTKRTASWKGDLEANPDAPNSENLIAEVGIARTPQKFSQTIRNEGANKIEMSFKCRCSLDYNGVGIEIRCVRDDGTYQFFNFSKMKAYWEKIHLSFTDLSRSKSLEIEVRIPPGAKGTIMFDEFSAQPFP